MALYVISLDNEELFNKCYENDSNDDTQEMTFLLITLGEKVNCLKCFSNNKKGIVMNHEVDGP